MRCVADGLVPCPGRPATADQRPRGNGNRRDAETQLPPPASDRPSPPRVALGLGLTGDARYVCKTVLECRAGFPFQCRSPEMGYTRTRRCFFPLFWLASIPSPYGSSFGGNTPSRRWRWRTNSGRSSCVERAGSRKTSTLSFDLAAENPVSFSDIKLESSTRPSHAARR